MQNNDLRNVQRYAVGKEADRVFIAFIASIGLVSGARRVLLYELAGQYIRLVKTFDVTRTDTPNRINSLGFISLLVYIVISALSMEFASNYIICFVFFVLAFICMFLFALFLKSFFLYQLSCPIGIAWDEANKTFVVLYPDFLYYRLHIAGDIEKNFLDESHYKFTWWVTRYAIRISTILASLLLIALPITYAMASIPEFFSQIYDKIEMVLILMHFVFIALLIADLPFLFLNNRVTSYACFTIHRHDVLIIRSGIIFNGIMASNFATGGTRKIGKFFMWDTPRKILAHKNNIIIGGTRKVVMLNEYKKSFRAKLGLLEYIVGIHIYNQKPLICTNKAIYIGDLQDSELQKIYEWSKSNRKNPIIATIVHNSKIYGIYPDKSVETAILA